MALAAVALVGCRGAQGPPKTLFVCAPGVVARTQAADLAFSAGWTRLALSACPGATAAARLEVEGADRRLAYAPGRPGGATAAVLTASETPADGELQVFAAPPESAQAREVVLAPWPFATPPPRLRRISLLAGAR